MAGAIWLHRQLLDCAELKEPFALALWVHLLLRAAYKPARLRFSRKVHSVDRGQLVTSLRQVAQESGISLQRVRTLLTQFQHSRMIKINTVGNTVATVITICKYNDFQPRVEQSNTADNTALTQSERKNQHREQESKKEESTYESPNGASSVESVEAGFRAFYAAYPRKVGPQKAAEKYRAALKATSHEEIMDGLRRAKLAWERKGTTREYIPHPATWLHGGRWADDDFIAGETSDPIGEAERMSLEILRKMKANGHDSEFTGTHCEMPDGPSPSVWDWPEDNAGANDEPERPLHRSLIGRVAGNA